MPYYYDKDGEIIIESMHDLYYKVGLMREDSKKEYEIHNHIGEGKSQEETSKLKKMLENNKEKD